MIDLKKEREAFEDQWKKNGYFHFNLERENGEERYSHRHVNFSFKFWCQRAELAQEETNKVESMNHHLAEINSDLDRSISIMKTEITELKQQLSEAHASRIEFVEYMRKIESGEFVLMPRKLSENMVLHAHKYHEGEPYLPYSLYESFVEAVEKDHE